jgi:hypothetical protein
MAVAKCQAPSGGRKCRSQRLYQIAAGPIILGCFAALPSSDEMVQMKMVSSSIFDAESAE